QIGKMRNQIGDTGQLDWLQQTQDALDQGGRGQAEDETPGRQTLFDSGQREDAKSVVQAESASSTLLQMGNNKSNVEPGVHIDPELEPIVSEMRKYSPTFDAKLRELEESARRSGKTYHVISGRLPPAIPGGDGPAYTEPDYFGRGAIIYIDRDQLPKFD